MNQYSLITFPIFLCRKECEESINPNSHLATIHIVRDTNTYASNMYSHISSARGFMKLNSSAGSTSGFLKRMEIPRFIKGFVKSITFSLE